MVQYYYVDDQQGGRKKLWIHHWNHEDTPTVLQLPAYHTLADLLGEICILEGPSEVLAIPAAILARSVLSRLPPWLPSHCLTDLNSYYTRSQEWSIGHVQARRSYRDVRLS